MSDDYFNTEWMYKGYHCAIFEHINGSQGWAIYENGVRLACAWGYGNYEEACQYCRDYVDMLPPERKAQLELF